MRENDTGVSLIKVHSKLKWKCHNETLLVQRMYNKKMFKFLKRVMVRIRE
jgi:hypothetical protein